MKENQRIEIMLKGYQSKRKSVAGQRQLKRIKENDKYLSFAKQLTKKVLDNLLKIKLSKTKACARILFEYKQVHKRESFKEMNTFKANFQ